MGVGGFLEGGLGKQIVVWQIRSRTNYACIFHYTLGLAYS